MPALQQHRKDVHAAKPRLERFVETHMGVCHYCERSVSLEDFGDGLIATRDHIIPVALNGTNAQNNLVLACKRCNNLRGHSDYEAFRRLMQGESVTRAELWPHLFGESA